MADIPGIIEGAHKGLGLGLSFLQHIERVKVILYLIDLTGDDLYYNFQLLQNELSTYNEELLNRPHYLVLTKSDLLDEDEIAEKIKDLKKESCLCLSSETGFNIENLLKSLEDLMEKGSVEKRTT
jgi:GTP-binding protein